ncbi:hypothetical protein [Hyalangium rubrum]|uniref:Mercuric ion transport protein n=1 Tax=Hyalangium rubrum TaxID=3103134 RepID=A0ABU5H0N0_9BACT|nr:hypothetical protein [Hyalangium sp. s54d21]MDY7226965.1 hypothetical protein [Hyalangium sp. s54d21]
MNDPRPNLPPSPPSGAARLSKKLPVTFFSLGVILCALCCSIPLLVGLGLSGAALTAIGAYGERLGVAFIGLGMLGFIWGLVRRRKAASHGPSCSTTCGCRTGVSRGC